MTNVPACPMCGGPAVWKAEANGWGCDRCRQMLPPPAPSMQAAPRCPRCSAPAVFHAQVSRWGCDQCRAYLDTMGPPPPMHDERAAKRAIASRRMLFGLVLLIVGIAITAGTYNEASNSGGGTYLIAYGPMVVGGIRFFQGLGGLIV